MADRYYVYALVDPRTKRPFYIGKGIGGRIDHHEMAVRGDREKNIAKANYIRAIWARGMKVEKRILGWFAFEGSALAWEKRLIRRFHGLTNISYGSARVYSFYSMVENALTGRSFDLVLFSKAFPRHILPSKIYTDLYDLAVYAVENKRFATSTS